MNAFTISNIRISNSTIERIEKRLTSEGYRCPTVQWVMGRIVATVSGFHIPEEVAEAERIVTDELAKPVRCTLWHQGARLGSYESISDGLRARLISGMGTVKID